MSALIRGARAATDAWQAVEDWWMEPQDGRRLAIVRILLGLVVAGAYASWLPHAEFVWGEQGVHAFFHSGNALNVQIVNAFTTELFTLAIISGLMVSIGLFTRHAAVVAIVVNVLVCSLGVYHTWGWSTAIHTMYLYLILANAGSVYSFDAWWKQRQHPDRPVRRTVPGWGVRLIQMHVAAVYLAAAWHRIDAEGWLTGNMVYDALTYELFTRFPGVDFYPYRRLLEISCWIGWFFELIAPVTLWIDKFKIRTFTVIGLLGLHFTLEATSTVGWWQVTMMSALLIFMPQSWADLVFDRIPWKRFAARLGIRSASH